MVDSRERKSRSRVRQNAGTFRGALRFTFTRGRGDRRFGAIEEIGAALETRRSRLLDLPADYPTKGKARGPRESLRDRIGDPGNSGRGPVERCAVFLSSGGAARELPGRESARSGEDQPAAREDQPAAGEDQSAAVVPLAAALVWWASRAGAVSGGTAEWVHGVSRAGPSAAAAISARTALQRGAAADGRTTAAGAVFSRSVSVAGAQCGHAGRLCPCLRTADGAASRDAGGRS